MTGKIENLPLLLCDIAIKVNFQFFQFKSMADILTNLLMKCFFKVLHQPQEIDANSTIWLVAMATNCLKIEKYICLL